MTNEQVILLLRKAVNKYGKWAQEFQFYEETGELLQALNKYRRSMTPERLANVHEEIADVQIMLMQLSLVYGYEQTCACLETKLQKLSKRLEK